MQGFVTNIEEATLKNEYFRQVLYTASHMQLVVMCLKPGEEIGEEVHTLDQFFRIESGEGKAVLNGEAQFFKNGSVVVIPKGVKHNIINTGAGALKLYTIYAPPNHPDQTVHKTKEEALAAEKHH